MKIKTFALLLLSTSCFFHAGAQSAFQVRLIYISYIVGFILLLPLFKENLSHGLYLYIVITGFGSLIILALFVARQIRKETEVLNLLKNI